MDIRSVLVDLLPKADGRTDGEKWLILKVTCPVFFEKTSK
jgi:hypothetical protein